MRNNLLARQNIIFFISQMLVGGLNYLFQVTAAQQLLAADFGSWAEWLAKFSLATFIAMWIQTLSTINDLSGLLHHRYAKFLILLPILLMPLSIALGCPTIATGLAWFLSVLSGFFAGVVLRQGKLLFIALATTISSLSKFIWVYFDHGPRAYHSAVLISGLFLALTLFILLHVSSKKSTHQAKIHLVAGKMLTPFNLALFATWVPQANLLVSGKLMSGVELGLFSKANLFAKAFFFIFQILAQILLSLSVRTNSSHLRLSQFLTLLCSGLFFSVFGYFLAPSLGWSPTWVFFNILDTSALCLLYLLLQNFSVIHDSKNTTALTLLSLGASVSCLIFTNQIAQYWQFNLPLQMLLAFYFLRLYLNKARN